MDVRVGIKKSKCLTIDAFELWCWRRLESPLDSKEIKPVNPKGKQHWILIGRTDTEAEAPILWPPDVKSRFTGKYPDARKDWRQEEKGTTEDEMVGWHHQFNGHESEQTLGDSEGQGSLACCSLWGCRVGHDRLWKGSKPLSAADPLELWCSQIFFIKVTSGSKCPATQLSAL